MYTTYMKVQTNSPIDLYISQFPHDTQAILIRIKSIIEEAAPSSVQTIKYGIPTFVLDGKNLIHFAGYAKHIGFYPTPGVLEAFSDELTKFVRSKGAVQFPLDKPIPFGLIKDMVSYRVKALKGEE